MTTFWNDDVLDALADCPPAALRWSAAAYRAGTADGFADGFRRGYTAAEDDLCRAWSTVAEQVRDRAGAPNFAELSLRRLDCDHEPCQQACGACSRCIHAEAYARRGGRDFLGVTAEANLTRRAG